MNHGDPVPVLAEDLTDEHLGWMVSAEGMQGWARHTYLSDIEVQRDGGIKLFYRWQPGKPGTTAGGFACGVTLLPKEEVQLLGVPIPADLHGPFLEKWLAS